jgi:hypothetical protein
LPPRNVDSFLQGHIAPPPTIRPSLASSGLEILNNPRRAWDGINDALYGSMPWLTPAPRSKLPLSEVMKTGSPQRHREHGGTVFFAAKPPPYLDLIGVSVPWRMRRCATARRVAAGSRERSATAVSRRIRSSCWVGRAGSCSSATSGGSSPGRLAGRRSTRGTGRLACKPPRRRRDRGRQVEARVVAARAAGGELGCRGGVS